MEKMYINCKFRNECIVPLLAVNPNFELWMTPEPQRRGLSIETNDRVKAKICACEVRDIFSLEEDIKRLYNIDPWKYLSMWNKACEGQLNSLTLFHIHLIKEEDYNGAKENY